MAANLGEQKPISQTILLVRRMSPIKKKSDLVETMGKMIIGELRSSFLFLGQIDEAWVHFTTA